jgi:hypothetical protein
MGYPVELAGQPSVGMGGAGGQDEAFCYFQTGCLGSVFEGKANKGAAGVDE